MVHKTKPYINLLVWAGTLTLAATAALLVAAIVKPPPAETPPETPEQRARRNMIVDNGVEGTLQGVPLSTRGPADSVTLGKTESAYEAFTNAVWYGNKGRIAELKRSGKVYSLPAGTVRAKKVYSNWSGSIKVKILSGSHRGEVAWTAMECLQRW